MIFPQQHIYDYNRRLFEIIGKQEQLVDDIQDDLLNVFETVTPTDSAEAEDQRRLDPELQRQLDRVEERMETVRDETDWENIAQRSTVPVVEAVNSQFESEVQNLAGVRPLRQNDLLDNIIQERISDQVDLIKTLPERHFDDIETMVRDAVDEGWGVDRLAQNIPRSGAKTRFNATRIARDQIGTATGEITKTRHEQAGFDFFVWDTVGDSRVRDEHQERAGQKYRWDNPPDGEVPGEPIQCRCVAQVVRSEATRQFGLPEGERNELPS